VISHFSCQSEGVKLRVKGWFELRVLGIRSSRALVVEHARVDVDPPMAGVEHGDGFALHEPGLGRVKLS
jgi:hypothetical protein